MPNRASRLDTVSHEQHLERGPESAPKHSRLRPPFPGNVDRHDRGHAAFHGYSWRDATANALHLLGMALAMTLPMIGWMRVRGHGWRHGIEMSLGMLLPWVAVLALVALGAVSVLPWLEQAGGPAMFLGMLGVMLLRPGHYSHAHHHAAATRANESADYAASI
jgi:hypothetical protein